VPGAGCRVPGAGCRVPGAGCRVPGAGCRVPGAGVTIVKERNTARRGRRAEGRRDAAQAAAWTMPGGTPRGSPGRGTLREGVLNALERHKIYRPHPPYTICHTPPPHPLPPHHKK
jgi:hypothetical protein